MRRRLKIAAVVFLASALLLLPVIVGWITPLTPSTPAAWNNAHAGMTHSELLALLGPPQVGAFPEKIVEEWHRDGIFGLRKLTVRYDRLPSDERGTQVSEIIFWRPSGRHIVERTDRR
jgi:hypothetical protein